MYQFILQKKRKEKENSTFPGKTCVNYSTLWALSESVGNVSRLEGPSAAVERLSSLRPAVGLVACALEAHSLKQTLLPGLRCLQDPDTLRAKD